MIDIHCFTTQFAELSNNYNCYVCEKNKEQPNFCWIRRMDILFRSGDHNKDFIRQCASNYFGWGKYDRDGVKVLLRINHPRILKLFETVELLK